MRAVAVLAFALTAAMPWTAAVAQTNSGTRTVLLLRGGLRAGEFTYRYVEAFQERGRWIYPDAGYIDFGDAGRYREIFLGAGGVIFTSKYLTVVEEGFIQQAIGPAAGGATYFLPWTLAALRFTPKLSGEVVYFPFLAATAGWRTCASTASVCQSL